MVTSCTTKDKVVLFICNGTYLYKDLDDNKVFYMGVDGKLH